jgi:hypothetical protein
MPPLASTGKGEYLRQGGVGDVRSNVQPAHVPEPPELHLAGGAEGRAGLQRRRPAGAHVRFDVGSVEAAHDVPTERRVTPEGVVGRFRACFLHFGPGPVLAPRGAACGLLNKKLFADLQRKNYLTSNRA